MQLGSLNHQHELPSTRTRDNNRSPFDTEMPIQKNISSGWRRVAPERSIDEYNG
jgi:hypothetical protein